MSYVIRKLDDDGDGGTADAISADATVGKKTAAAVRPRNRRRTQRTDDCRCAVPSSSLRAPPSRSSLPRSASPWPLQPHPAVATPAVPHRHHGASPRTHFPRRIPFPCRPQLPFPPSLVPASSLSLALA
ncbi:hypothetical protein PLICRDRAFT_175650 [Plicaturopsis crispa FD-325 SS-3]|nr:hypothetical protein PLICRDRAFT_175650 [Plicaturopsis crispa FD-325 SS-3]